MSYTNEDLQKDIKELKFQSRLQTIAVVLVFVFGIVTIRDVMKKK